MNSLNIFLTILVLCWRIPFCICSKGFVEVNGQILCNGKPWRHEKVKVYESNFLLPDPLLATNWTDSDGKFYLKAYGEDIYPLRPYIYLPNYCNAEEFLDREWAKYLRIRIPEFYVDQWNPRLLEMGKIELSHEKTDQVGLQKLTDWIKNFAECRPIRKPKVKKMSEI